MDIPKIKIPALRADGTTQRIVVPAGERAGVLIVDDTPAKLVALAAIVSGMALEIVTATSGEQALRQLLKRDFAVILLDVNMPMMDGFETATLIRSRPRSEHTPIIFVTAEASSEAERVRGYIHGAVDFICSPISPDILRAKVRVSPLYHPAPAHASTRTRRGATGRDRAEAGARDATRARSAGPAGCGQGQQDDRLFARHQPPHHRASPRHNHGQDAGQIPARSGAHGALPERLTGRVEDRLSPALPHQTVLAICPHTAFRCSSHRGMHSLPSYIFQRDSGGRTCVPDSPNTSPGRCTSWPRHTASSVRVSSTG